MIDDFIMIEIKTGNRIDITDDPSEGSKRRRVSP